MQPHRLFPMQDTSQVGEARRAVSKLAADAGLGELDTARAALVATELGTNLVRHAQHGALLMHATTGPNGGCIELLSLDHGPGMADVQRCLEDGYSSAGTAGTGLGAVRRNADRFSIYSHAGHGTVVAARIGTGADQRSPTGFEAAAICLAAPGETVSGDAWQWRREAASAWALVVDGLGHGPLARDAAAAAVAAFDQSASASPAGLLEDAHEALRGTRGAAAAVAVLDADAGTVVFAGAGNVVGRLLSGVQDRSLLSQHGTLGLQVRRLQDVTYPWPEHAVLVMHTDGLLTRWNLDDAPGLLQCEPIVIAAWLMRANRRGRDDATVLVMRRA